MGWESPVDKPRTGFIKVRAVNTRGLFGRQIVVWEWLAFDEVHRFLARGTAATQSQAKEAAIAAVWGPDKSSPFEWQETAVGPPPPPPLI